MIHPKQNIPVQKYRVDECPDAKTLTQYVEHARKFDGVKHCYQWTEFLEQQDCLVTLTILSPEDGEQLEWWLHRQSEKLGDKMLWLYRTNDYAVIFTQLMVALGRPDPLEAFQKGKSDNEEVADAASIDSGVLSAKKPSSLGEKFKSKLTSPEQDTSPSANPNSPARFLSGTFKNKPIGGLLKSISNDELTGHLHVDTQAGRTSIQFGLGKPVHAIGPNFVGTEAIMELFLKNDGQLSFEEDKQPESATVQETSEEIIRTGIQYLEGNNFLKSYGIHENSILQRTREKLSEDELETRLFQGMNVGLEIQKEFFGDVYGTRSLAEIGEKLSLERSKYVTIATNLMKLGLLLTPEGKNVNESAPKPLAVDGAASFPVAQVTQDQPPASETTEQFKQSQSGAQKTDESAAPWAQAGKQSGSSPLMPPSFVFGGGAASSAQSSMAQNSQPQQQQQSQQPPQQPPQQPSATFPLPAQTGAAQDQPGAGAIVPPAPQDQPGAGAIVPPAPQDQPGAGAIVPPAPQDQPGAGAIVPPAPQEQPGAEAIVPPAPQEQPGAEAIVPPAPQDQPGAGAIVPPAPQEQPGFGAMIPPVPQQSPDTESVVSRGTAPQEQAPGTTAIGPPGQPTSLDASSLSNTITRLSSSDTGIMTFDAFQFFLDREYRRAFNFKTNFTLAVFCIKSTAGAELPSQQLATIMSYIGSVIRDVDVLGHFGEQSFAIILPNVESRQCTSLADHIMSSLHQSVPGSSELTLHFGLASIPEDCQDLSTLSMTAQTAMVQAANNDRTALVGEEVATTT